MVYKDFFYLILELDIIAVEVKARTLLNAEI